jgi:hypothetical protein
MENTNNDPAVEAVVEAPKVEQAPVVEETPVVEALKVEEAPVEPAKDEEPKATITAPSYEGKSEKEVLGSAGNGAIGTETKKVEPKKAAPAKSAKSEKTVALKSTKNVTWTGVGKVSKGINIVSEAEAAQWLTRDHITEVTPAEVAKEFGK